jgi:hypothetical protein
MLDILGEAPVPPQRVITRATSWFEIVQHGQP